MFQFSFDVRHRAKWLYIISNVLFKLTTMKKEDDRKIEEILNEISVFNENVEVIVVIKLIKQIIKERKNIASQDTSKNAIIFHIYLINMSDDFKKKLIDVYAKFIKWKQIMNIVRKAFLFSNIQFSIDDDLTYYIDFVNRKKLCLFKKFKRKIFKQIHNRNYHAEFIKTYEVISINFYFHKLSNRLQRYIIHYRKCNLC